MKCPTCESPDPKLHPAVQFEGEVHLCEDSFHNPTANARQRMEEDNESVVPGLCTAQEHTDEDAPKCMREKGHAGSHISGNDWSVWDTTMQSEDATALRVGDTVSLYDGEFEGVIVMMCPTGGTHGSRDSAWVTRYIDCGDDGGDWETESYCLEYMRLVSRPSATIQSLSDNEIHALSRKASAEWYPTSPAQSDADRKEAVRDQVRFEDGFMAGFKAANAPLQAFDAHTISYEDCICGKAVGERASHHPDCIARNSTPIVAMEDVPSHKFERSYNGAWCRVRIDGKPCGLRYSAKPHQKLDYTEGRLTRQELLSQPDECYETTQKHLTEANDNRQLADDELCVLRQVYCGKGATPDMKALFDHIDVVTAQRNNAVAHLFSKHFCNCWEISG